MCEIKAVSGSTKPCKRKFVRPSVYLELLHFVNMLSYGKWGWAPYISSSTVIFTFTCLCVSNVICYCIGMHMSYTCNHHWCICIDKFFKQCTNGLMKEGIYMVLWTKNLQVERGGGIICFDLYSIIKALLWQNLLTNACVLHCSVTIFYSPYMVNVGNRFTGRPYLSQKHMI